MSNSSLNSIELAVFLSRLCSICEEMGEVLKKTAISPNIKDRLDYSCAFFDRDGKIIAQAAHIPVHLGSMAYAMKHVVNGQAWRAGDVLILNDPFKGGTHLPDVTVVAPVFHEKSCVGYFACRAHHANIGCEEPGSMPLSSSLEEEGIVIEPTMLFSAGVIQKGILVQLAKIESVELGHDGGDESLLPGDFSAQVSALNVGVNRVAELLSSEEQSAEFFVRSLEQLNQYGELVAKQYLSDLPRGQVTFQDVLDNDGYGAEDISIRVTLSVEDKVKLDFTGTANQVQGNLNCPLSVCAASVFYVFACLLPDYVPHCDGVFSSVEITAPEGCLVNALPGAAVAAGNVETSMRIVDVVIGALSKLGVDVPAASQGTMNNVAMGGNGWNYYETIGGGMGASDGRNGLSGVQCHMTNSLNTPVESLEMHYPLRVVEYGLRENSGGSGAWTGGDGLVRSYEFLSGAKLTLLTERRQNAPWGAEGGLPGRVGKNYLNGKMLEGKVATQVNVGDVLSILTPGGGGFGEE